jgi:hypothetical protein
MATLPHSVPSNSSIGSMWEAQGRAVQTEEGAADQNSGVLFPLFTQAGRLEIQKISNPLRGSRATRLRRYAVKGEGG